MSEPDQQPPAESGQLAVRIVRVVLDPKQPPKALHKAMHTGVNNDMILELGYLDLRESYDLIQEARNRALPDEPQNVNFFITDRFIVTPDAAVDLLRITQRMVEYFQKRSLLPASLSEHRQGFLHEREGE